MLGGSKRRGRDVVEEINKMGQQKTISIFGSEEKGFPLNEVRLNNFSNHTRLLAGYKPPIVVASSTTYSYQAMNANLILQNKINI